MTKEEAIKILEEGKQDEYTRYQFETCLWTAVDMAIEALKKQKTGKWFTNIKKGTITCQVCKEEISYYPSIGIRPLWEYCPYCGSYNGGEQDD